MPEVEIVESKSINWPKIILASVLGLALLAGAAYTGYWYGTQQAQQIQQTEKPAAVPQPSPITKPKKIAFLKGKERDDSFVEIWTVMSDGSDERSTGIKLENFEKYSTFFTQSPGFKFVCFEDDRGGLGAELYLLDLERNSLERISNSFFPVTDTRDGSWLRRLQWSEDSRKILYTVSHHPYEFDRGAPIEKEPPAKENWHKMGIFVYDVESKETIRLSDEVARWLREPLEEGENYEARAVSWWSDSDTLILRGYVWEWLELDFYGLSSEKIHKTVPSFSHYIHRFAFAKNGDTYGPQRLSGAKEGVAKWDREFKERIIYHKDYKGANAPPVILSPDEKHIAFSDPDGKIIVVPTTNLDEFKKYDNTNVGGRWFKYQWLSNDEILFWESESKNLFKLNIITSELTQLTTGGNVWWRGECF